MKRLMKYFLSELLFFPRYLKKNGYVETWAYVCESDWRIWRLRYFSCLFTPLIITIIVLIITTILFIWFIEISSERNNLLITISYIMIILIIYFPFSFSIFYLTTRRLHDIWRSWWWQIIGFLWPIGFFLLIMLLSKWDSFNNKFWPPPEKS